MKKKDDLLSLPTRRILLVDDDSSFREEFSDLFRDYGVCEASSGEEALQILGKPHEIDLVVLDFKLAGLDGIEVLDRIKKEQPHIRTIILTGYSSTQVAVEALRKKADDYIEKPLDPVAFEKLIKKWLWTGKDTINPVGDDIETKINRLKTFIQRNYSKKLTLRDAAALVYLSPKYLSRAFKEHAKIGFNEYKLQLKLEQAKILLTRTRYGIGQIADQLAYQNLESFIRQFKKMTKLTPTAFRKKQKK